MPAPALPAPPVSQDDLDYMVLRTESLWDEMRNRRVFITGGTGFFGRWLLEGFLAANRAFDLQAQAVVLTRSAPTFRQRCPHLAENSAVELVQGDVRTFAFPAGEFPFVIHAATESVPQGSPRAAEDMLSTIVDGTRRCLDFAETHGTRKFLLTSSGAVYGPQPSAMTHIEESYNGAPEPLRPGSEYGEGKRVAEMLCGMTARRTGLECKIARCFAFVGPHLPLDAHFAIGNFIRDAMHGGPILIQGDGTPMRSYMYAADLAIWLWTMLFRAPSTQAFNVGSAHALSIRAVAEEVSAAIQPEVEIQILKQADPAAPLHRYVPDVSAAERELGLRQGVSLGEAIERTADWHLRRRDLIPRQKQRL